MLHLIRLPEFQQQVQELIMLKSTAAESAPIGISNELKLYLETEYAAISEASGSIERNNFEADLLDDFFVRTITRYDH